MRKSFSPLQKVFKTLKISALKTAFISLLPLLLQIKFNIIGGVPSVVFPSLHTLFPDLGHVAAAVLVNYELIIRLVPSLENNSLFHLAGLILNGLVPNHAVTFDGGVGYHVTDEVVIPKPGAGGTGLAVA